MRWFSLLAFALVGLSLSRGEDQQNDPRLRMLLPSGAIAFVESMPGAKHFSLQLIASSRGAKDLPETHGWRHLLEHLVTKGPDKGLESRLEANGVFLNAETHRDAMSFSLIGPPEKLEAALAAVRELLQPLRTTEKEVEQEVRIIGQEIALSSPSKKLSRALWLKAFGLDALDPVGSLEALGKATPTSLELLRRRHFAPQNLVLSLAGPFEVDGTLKQLVAILPKEKGPFEPVQNSRKEGKAASAMEGAGEGIGVPAPAWDESETAANLAGALALASERENCFVIYTPSTQPGLIILGTEERGSGLGAWLKNLKAFEIDALFARGRLFAEGWLKRYLNTPEGCAFLRGFLYAQSTSSTPEALLEKIRAISLEQFRAAVGRFQSGGAS